MHTKLLHSEAGSNSLTCHRCGQPLTWSDRVPRSFWQHLIIGSKQYLCRRCGERRFVLRGSAYDCTSGTRQTTRFAPDAAPELARAQTVESEAVSAAAQGLATEGSSDLPIEPSMGEPMHDVDVLLDLLADYESRIKRLERLHCKPASTCRPRKSPRSLRRRHWPKRRYGKDLRKL